MNIAKIEMLGCAIQAAQGTAEGTPFAEPFNEPPEAQPIRYVKGIVALVMESADPPQTLQELRTRITEMDIQPEHRVLLPYTVFDLLADDILVISPDRKISYCPPETEIYTQAVSLED